ncbi:conserved Plasmodium protein, unknown function [Plasmodium gallinaceum]|uniref:Uncharacterized protein n=1 Tax=Plasmodium gallinaceum TaxID=5849 RepID=A0A1J1GMF3_PLAGA|nr:conserved Plasmodium protein, unknown function [Plasmodium gallinaceum]CRG93540.1 conserved Plasmodium protein, unknown function [Plasmodium gallinaceum]
MELFKKENEFTKNNYNEKNKIEKLEEINDHTNNNKNNKISLNNNSNCIDDKNNFNNNNLDENDKNNFNDNNLDENDKNNFNNNNLDENDKNNFNNNNLDENDKNNFNNNNLGENDKNNFNDNNLDENNSKLNDSNNNLINETYNSSEDDNKLIENDKRKIIIFSSILRYKRYLTKKGNTYFDFNQTNLELNEKEMLVQSSNFYHLFDLRSLFFPHIYLNINSHMNINISDYLNYIKNQQNEGIKNEENKDLNYFSKQEFILESIEQVEHIEIKVKIIKKLFLILNENVSQKFKNYIDNLPYINSNDYIFVQTNRKNDILFGYIKSNKFNLFFEILNFKKMFFQYYKDNIKIDIYDINSINNYEDYFENINGIIFLKEQNIFVKKDLFENINFYSKYYYDYYFSKNSIVEYDYSNKKKKFLLVFNLCVNYVKNNLFIIVIYNDNNCNNNSNDNNSKFLYYEELDLYNKQFNLNNIDKNLFKTNSFFIDNLYHRLKSKLLCSFSFKHILLNDYLTSINISKIKKNKFYKNFYTFNIFCLSNEGIVYIFFCNLLILNIFYENKFELIVKKYFCFQLNKESLYRKIRVVNCNSKYLYSLCTHSNFPYKKFHDFVNENVLSKNLNDTLRNTERESIIHCDDDSNKIENIFTNSFSTYEKSDNENVINNNDLDYKINNSHSNIDCYINKKEYSNYTGMTEYKYTFLIITCKYDFSIVTLRRRKKNFNMELINYSCTNSKNSNNVICDIIVNKCNFEKYNENKKKNKSFIIFEIICFYQNGFMKKYSYVCSLKNKNFEFFLMENEKMKNGIISKKIFFKPVLFPFNEEVLKKKKKCNDIILNNVHLSHFKNFIYIYFQEKQYESISLTINNQCLIISYIKTISKLFKKIYTLLNKKNEKENINSNVNNKKKENFESYLSINKNNNFLDKNNEMNYYNDKINSFLDEVNKSSEFYDKNIKNYLNCNLFTQREHKTFFLEYKYIIFGFYDIHLINEKNNKNINEMKTKVNKKNSVSSCDIHSHFNFLNIIKSYINYDNIKKSIHNLTNENKKIKMNFYYFLLILNYFQNNYISEYNSFFHLAYNELYQKVNFTYKRKIYSKLFFENFELIDIKKYGGILLSFLFHMYNFCLKQNGLSNDDFNSHITFFLINKKTKKNKKKFRYIYKMDENKNTKSYENLNKDETKAIQSLSEEYKKDNFDNIKNNITKKNTEFDDKKMLMNENKKVIINFLTLKKCLYYINKIKKYMSYILNTEVSDCNTQFDICINIYICQIFYIILNTLRINNTNIFVNLNYNIKKNNLDYFYILILINFYSLFYLLISPENILKENIENEKKVDNEENKINKDMDILNFFNNIYVEYKNKNIEKTNSSNIENISITSESFEKYLALTYEIIKEKTNKINVDNYIVEKLLFKINCFFCNKICISNLYNNYYICENNHIFNKCMITFCCIYKNNLILPTIFILNDFNKKLFDNFNAPLNFNLLIQVDYIYFCSFCYYFISTKNTFFEKNFLFNQCPFCNHELNIL